MPSQSTRGAHILVVDDERVILQFLEELLKSEGYEVDLANDGEKAIELLKINQYDVVLTDIKMPNVDGIDILNFVSKMDNNIMTLVMTGYATVETAVDALKLGAYNYIIKPFQIEEILISLERAIEKRNLILENQEYQKQLEVKVVERTEDLKRALDELNKAHQELKVTYDETLRAISALLDLKDTETEGHSKRVTEYTIAVGRNMAIPEHQLVSIWRGALLHDIGKVGIPDSILLKPGPLTDEERMIMETHPVIGFKALEGIGFLREAIPVIRHHQERWDGTGYPSGLLGDEIPIGARLFAVADAFDAITSDRPYRRAQTYQQAKDEIRSFSGTQFDPKVVEAFLVLTEEEFVEMGARFPKLVKKAVGKREKS